MKQLEDAYFTRFRDFLKSTQAVDSNPKNWHKAKIKWAHTASHDLDKIWEAAIPAELKKGNMEALHAAFFKATHILLLPDGGTACGSPCALRGGLVGFPRSGKDVSCLRW